MNLHLTLATHGLPLWFLVFSLFLPRILILFWIYQDQGISLWLLIHAVGLIVAWGGGSGTYVRRRRVDVID